MDASTFLTDAERETLRTLTEAAEAGAPCPSVDMLARSAGLKRDPTQKLMKRLEAFGLIRTVRPAPGQRVVLIVETGKKTAPTLTGGQKMELARSVNVGWPERTMTAAKLDEALAKAGRFEDSLRAIRDRGSFGMPARHSLGATYGISDVYGSRGVRTGAGSPL